jgi:hypothetical protein
MRPGRNGRFRPSAADLSLRKTNHLLPGRNVTQLKVLSLYHRNLGQLTVTESVVLPP